MARVKGVSHIVKMQMMFLLEGKIDRIQTRELELKIQKLLNEITCDACKRVYKRSIEDQTYLHARICRLD